MWNVTGVTVTVQITGNPFDKHAEAALVAAINRAVIEVNNNKCELTVQQLAQQYYQTFDVHERCRLEHLIDEQHRKALRGTAPWELLDDEVKLLTNIALKRIKLDRAKVGHSILLYCEINTVEALYQLQRMIDSGELSRLFSRMLSLLAATEVIATASLTEQQYDMALKSLTSAGGKAHYFNNSFNVQNHNSQLQVCYFVNL